MSEARAGSPRIAGLHGTRRVGPKPMVRTGLHLDRPLGRLLKLVHVP